MLGGPRAEPTRSPLLFATLSAALPVSTPTLVPEWECDSATRGSSGTSKARASPRVASTALRCHQGSTARCAAASFGGVGSSEIEKQAINELGVSGALVVVAAGNGEGQAA